SKQRVGSYDPDAQTLFSATSALFLSARRLPRPGRGGKFLLSVRCDLLSLCRSSPTFPRTPLQFVLNYFFSPISSGGTLASNQPHRFRLSPLPPLPPSALLYLPGSRLVPHRHRPRRRQAPHRRSRLRPSRRQRQTPRVPLHANRPRRPLLLRRHRTRLSQLLSRPSSLRPPGTPKAHLDRSSPQRQLRRLRQPHRILHRSRHPR